MDISAAQFRDSCSISIIVYQTLHFEDPLLGAIGMKKGCPQVEQLLT